jgi:hypothetical protein
MVAQNPLFSGRFTFKKFQATVINDIWPEVLFFTAVATGQLLRYLTVTELTRKLNSRGRCDEAGCEELGNQQRIVDRARYGTRFGYFFQDVLCIREVST